MPETPKYRAFPSCPSGEASSGTRSGSNRVDLIRVNPRNPLCLSALKFLLRIIRWRLARQRNLD
jgi:hypothetical protein